MSGVRAYAAGGFVALCLCVGLVSRWDEWLNESHAHWVDYPLKHRIGFERHETVRPCTFIDLARGFLPCLLFLAVCDVLICQRMRDDSIRFFTLHVFANLVISLSSAPDMLRALSSPFHEPIGRCNVLPVYMIPALFIYHLTVFRCVSFDEWIHHLLFGGGIGGVGLACAPGPLMNAMAFFICGLPGGIDYIMLILVKKGHLTSATEKVWNARINVWLRSPGLMITGYAIVLVDQSVNVYVASPWLIAMVVGLAALNGQYYMQRVVANTSHKVNGHGAC